MSKAALLDPRFKRRAFNSDINFDSAKSLMKDDLELDITDLSLDVNQPQSQESTEDADTFWSVFESENSSTDNHIKTSKLITLDQ